MICPRCKLVNADIALRCDCGYDFPSGTMKDSYVPQGQGLAPTQVTRPLASLGSRLAGQIMDSLVALVILGIGIALAIVWKRHDNTIRTVAVLGFLAYLLLAD